MALTWRQGLVVGGVLLAGIALGVSLMSASPPQAARDTAAAPAQAASASVASCGFDPLLQAAPSGDGQFSAPSEVIDKTLSDVAAYASVANDAVARGRVRDAEVALIMACRIAGHLAGAPSQELADTRYQLARHYTMVAAAGPAGDGQRGEVLRRAETLFAESMESYAARFGPPHEKTRLAAAGLTLARQATALAGQLQAAEVPPASASATLLALAAAKPASAASASATTAKIDTSVMGAAPATVRKKPKPKPEPEMEHRSTNEERGTIQVDAAPDRPAAAAGDARSGAEPAAP